MFNKIVKKQGGAFQAEIKIEQQKIEERLKFIIDKIGAVFKENHVNIFEAVDVLNNLKLDIDVKLSKIIGERDTEIKQLKDDLAKSKTDRGTENKE